MYLARKLVGALIIILLGVPLLCAIIWAVGFTRAAVSPGMVSELPERIATEVPRFVDGALAAAAEESGIKENARAWLKAVADSRISVTGLLIETGVTPWIKTEMAESFRAVAGMLKGETEPRPVFLNLRPLKLAFQHPAVERSLNEVLAKLPPCDAGQMETWRRIAADPSGHIEPPACRLDPAAAGAALLAARTEITRDIPDEVELFQADGARFFPPPDGHPWSAGHRSPLPFRDPGNLHTFGLPSGRKVQIELLPLERVFDTGRRADFSGDRDTGRPCGLLGHRLRSLPLP